MNFLNRKIENEFIGIKGSNELYKGIVDFLKYEQLYTEKITIDNVGSWCIRLIDMEGGNNFDVNHIHIEFTHCNNGKVSKEWYFKLDKKQYF